MRGGWVKCERLSWLRQRRQNTVVLSPQVSTCEIQLISATNLHRVQVEDMCSTQVISARQPLTVRADGHPGDDADTRSLIRVIVFIIIVRGSNANRSIPISVH
jgi:hypothetical protein